MIKQGPLINRLNKTRPSTSKETCDNGDSDDPSPPPGYVSVSETRKSSKCKRRKYHTNYIKFGFTCVEINGIQQPRCVLCGVILSNESLKPYKLKRHLHTKHQQYKDKPEEFFVRKKNEPKNRKSCVQKTVGTNKSLLEASFVTALHLARSLQPFTIAESLLKPCMMDICEKIGITETDKIRDIPMSDDIVRHATALIANDLREQLIQLVKKSPWFAIQIDESTDVSNESICLGYVRFIDHEREDIAEEMMFCLELEAGATSEDVFDKINLFFASHDIGWSNCVGICTDGGAATTGRLRGVVSRMKRVANPSAMATHCFIHWEQLVSEETSPELEGVMTDAVRVIDYIKTNALNSRVFSALCEEAGVDYTSPLLHAGVRWLSRGKALIRLLELKAEVEMFLNDKNPNLAVHFADRNWVAKLSYLADIFTVLNQLNSSAQGNQHNIFTMQDKVEAMKAKLHKWIQRIESNVFEMFPNYSGVITDNSEFDKERTNRLIQCHLRKLIEKFEKYFPSSEIDNGKLWIRDPYSNWENTNLPPIQEDTLIELVKDLSLNSLFKKKSLVQFWMHIRKEYPNLFTIAIQHLLPFASTYLCEKGFAVMVDIIAKQRDRLGIDSSMRIALSNAIEVRIDELVECIQLKKSR